MGCVDNDAFNRRSVKTRSTLNTTAWLNWRCTWTVDSIRWNTKNPFQHKQLHNSLFEHVCWTGKLMKDKYYNTRGLCRWIRTLRVRPDCRSSQGGTFQLDETRTRSTGFEIRSCSIQHYKRYCIRWIWKLTRAGTLLSTTKTRNGSLYNWKLYIWMVLQTIYESVFKRHRICINIDRNRHEEFSDSFRRRPCQPFCSFMDKHTLYTLNI